MKATGKTAGFTLTELLVVVAILATLAAIAVPSFSSYRRQGQITAAQAMNDAIVSAEKTYRQRHGAFWTDSTPSPSAANALANLGVNLNELPNFDVSITTSGSNVVVTSSGQSGGAAAGVTVATTYTPGGATTTTVTSE
jgi:type IV pilus assembly protein PilE